MMAFKEMVKRTTMTAFSRQGIWLLLIVCQAMGSGCALNSFQATIIPTPTTLTEDSRNLECDTPKAEKTFVLIHGIYGDEKTFGDLPFLLACDYNGSSVYTMEYWSHQWLPNFQRLIDLGREFQSKLEEIRRLGKPGEIIIIAHSQGGLIAREAILGLRARDPEGILNNLKLIMVGTPNRGSAFATTNNLIVNSAFSLITLPVSVVVSPFTHKALIYNRQAFDMRLLGESIAGFELLDAIFPSYTGELALRWGEAFQSNDRNNAFKLYAIVGVKNLIGEIDLSDGIVHSTSTLFAGVPSNRTSYVPYKHFSDEMNINKTSHRSYTAIKRFINDNNDAREQKLSPYGEIPLTWLAFVTDREEPEYHIIPEKPGDEPRLLFNYEWWKKMFFDKEWWKQGLWEGGKDLLMRMATSPLVSLQQLASYPLLFEHPQQDYTRPKWKWLSEPFLVLGGKNEGTVKVRGYDKDAFYYYTSRTFSGETNVVFSDDDKDLQAKCMVSTPVVSDSTRKTAPIPQKPHANKSPVVHVTQNSVNFVHFKASQKEEADEVNLEIQVFGCTDPWILGYTKVR